MIITIVKKPHGWQVEDGKVKGSREEWQARGSIIFVKGAMSAREYPIVANVAMNALLDAGHSIRGMHRTAKVGRK